MSTVTFYLLFLASLFLGFYLVFLVKKISIEIKQIKIIKRSYLKAGILFSFSGLIIFQLILFTLPLEINSPENAHVGKILLALGYLALVFKIIGTGILLSIRKRIHLYNKRRTPYK